MGQRAAEGGDLQRFGADHHMHDLEAAADDAGGGRRAHLFRRCVGGDIEILRFFADEQVAHRAADHIGLVALVPQCFAGASGGAGELFAAHAVSRCGITAGSDEQGALRPRTRVMNFRIIVPRWFLFFAATKGRILHGIRRLPSAAESAARSECTGQPASTACARSVSSGSTATGSLTFSSSGRSLCESLQNQERSKLCQHSPNDSSQDSTRRILPSRNAAYRVVCR